MADQPRTPRASGGVRRRLHLERSLLAESGQQVARRGAGQCRAPSVWGSCQQGARLDGAAHPRADVRLVKAPFRSGRRPNFEVDFDWSDSEGRQAAALRNHAAYNPPSRNPQAEPLFGFPLPNAADAVTQCREVFLVWGAELRTGLTAGWLGLPTASGQRWIAVTPVWWDEPPAQDSSTSGEGPGSYDGSTFGDKPAPVPALALKPRRQEGGNRL